ncbi:MAG: hypothetical protein RL477_1611 [Pseudomonadota bacterium]
MKGLLRQFKTILPWWAKIAAKIVLARLPLGERAWQSLGLFSPGEMMDPAYAVAVFDRHYRAAGSPAPGFSFLELGPGDSLSSAVIGKAYGASRCWLVDAGAYASRDMDVYRRLADHLARARPEADLGAVRRAGDVAALLVACNAVYLEDGLAGLRRVPDASCDLIFSQAVLEHVPRAEFAQTLTEMRRILKPGGVSTHQVDFRDHLAGGLNNLRFSQSLWEKPWFARRSGFYTNRLRAGEMTAMMAGAGFDAVVSDQGRWTESPIRRESLAAEFSNLSADDLLVREAFFVLRPRRQGQGSGMRRAVFLDRDGTINWNEVRGGKPYAPTRLEDYRWLPGAPEAIARFLAEGHLVIVVTNQPDLTTGKNSPAVIEEMHRRLRDELGVDDIFTCPHTEDQGCDCRKPRPGLLLQAARKWNIDLARSVMVGDRWRDVDAGKAAGCATVFIDHGYTGEPAPEGACLTVKSLAEAADFISTALAD